MKNIQAWAVVPKDMGFADYYAGAEGMELFLRHEEAVRQMSIVNRIVRQGGGEGYRVFAVKVSLLSPSLKKEKPKHENKKRN